MKIQESNYVEISGVITDVPQYSHELYGEKFYKTFIRSRRDSGTIDTIPVLISDVFICNDIQGFVGKSVLLKGVFRSYNLKNQDEGKNKTKLYVFVQEVEDAEEDDLNKISIEGYICKPPVYRKTPLGREVADLFLAINRPYGKSDYIPCICWGRNAKTAELFSVGMKIKANGRIQSREYIKRFDGDKEETRTAYEVSIGTLEVVEVKNESEN